MGVYNRQPEEQKFKVTVELGFRVKGKGLGFRIFGLQVSESGLGLLQPLFFIMEPTWRGFVSRLPMGLCGL